MRTEAEIGVPHRLARQPSEVGPIMVGVGSFVRQRPPLTVPKQISIGDGIGDVNSKTSFVAI